MKNTTKKKIFYTPENIGGACFTGKPMTPDEVVIVADWISERKANNQTVDSKAVFKKTKRIIEIDG